MSQLARDATVIEQFVAALNKHGLEPLFAVDVSPELRTRELPEIPDMFEWEIRPADDNPWVPALEDRLPSRFPQLYRLLISRYRFAEFEVGPIMFLANTGTDVHNELSHAVFADKNLSPMLLKRGLLQFGRRAGGHYDPVCFDMKRRAYGDAPLVCVDHEDVLIRDRIRITDEIAPKFRAFVERVIAGELWSN